MAHSTAFSRLGILIAYQKLEPIRNRGRSSTEEHQTALYVKHVATAMAEIAQRSPGWIQYIETSSLVDGVSLYQPEAYREAFPQTRYSVRMPPTAPGENVPYFQMFGRRGYAFQAITLVVTECGNDDLSIKLHMLMRPSTDCNQLVVVGLDGSIDGWQFVGNDSLDMLVSTVVGDADLDQRNAVMANAYPNSEVLINKSSFTEALSVLGPMLSSFAKIPAPLASETPNG